MNRPEVDIVVTKRAEYPEFAEGQWDGPHHAQVMDNGFSIDWPMTDEETVVIHTYFLNYYDDDGVKWNCEFKITSVEGEK